VLKQHGLAYLRRGLHALPVKNKIPLVDGWADKPVTSEEVQAWPSNCEVGLLTGPVNKLLVLDVDKEGLEQIDLKALPLTPTARTKNGGYHYYLRLEGEWPSATTIRGLFGKKGVDVRGKGGYVVAPPSAGYQWLPGRSLDSIPLAPPPQWLKDKLVNRPSAGPRYDGPRHPEFVRLASRYFNDGLTEAEVEQKMREWNEQVNSNPFPEDRFKKEMEDIARPWREGRYVSYRTKEVLGGINNSNAGMVGIKPVPVGDFLQGTKHIDWLVDRLIPRNGCSLMAGEMKLGKSWVMLDLAIEIARGGGKWLGQFPVTGGKVLYIDEENAEQLLRYRLDKLLKGKQGIEKLDLSLLVGKRFRFDNPQSYEELRRIIAEYRPTLVCCDAFVRFHNKDENSATAMAMVNSLVKGLVTEYSTTFIFTDHEPKVQLDERGKPVNGPGKPRGSGEKIAFADTVLSLRPTGEQGLMKVYHTYSRWGVPLHSFQLELADVGAEATKVQYRAGEL